MIVQGVNEAASGVYMVLVPLSKKGYSGVGGSPEEIHEMATWPVT